MRWPWQRESIQPQPMRHIIPALDDDRDREIAHQQAMQEMQEKTAQLRQWVDAIDLIGGPTQKEAS